MWNILFDPKMLILGPAMLLYWAFQHHYHSSNLIWLPIRVIRETQKALRVDGPTKDFWIPKSVIREIRIKEIQLEILIPLRFLP